jgi:hypothetical protein
MRTQIANNQAGIVTAAAEVSLPRVVCLLTLHCASETNACVSCLVIQRLLPVSVPAVLYFVRNLNVLYMAFDVTCVLFSHHNTFRH